MKRLIATAIIVLLLSMIEHSAIIAETSKREQREQHIKQCMENLRAMGKAIAAYKADHKGEMPDWLSNLYPKYLKDPKILLCPADKTGGTPATFTAYKDPKMPCSYLYEFNPMKFIHMGIVFDINPLKEPTYKKHKTMQLKYFGHLVPVVRCWHHGMQVLNLSYDGKIYYSSGAWEWEPESIKAVLSFFQSAIKRNPEGWEKEISLRGIYNYFRGLIRLPDLRAILEKQANLSVEALKILAEIYQSEGKIDKAIEIYNRLTCLAPKDVESRFQLAKLYATTKNYQAVQDQCQRIIQLEPNNSKAHALLVELNAIQDGLRIQRDLGKIPTGDPEMNYLIKLQEVLFSSKKDLKPAIKKARDILQESFGEPTSVTKIGDLYQKLDKSLANISGQWKTYTTSDGLINDYVYAIAQDKSGVLWIGTEKGVCQYDGESFIPFTINEKLNEAPIRSILIDKEKHLWFGTGSQGAVRYDGESFVNYTMENGLAGNYVNAIFQARDGSLWFSCSGGGITRYDGKTFKSFTTEDGLAGNQISTMIEDSRGNLWIGTRLGVSKYDGKTFTNLTEKDGLTGNSVSAIVEDRKGHLWFGTDKGVSWYDFDMASPTQSKEGKKIVSFTKKDGLIDNNISDILEDREGNLWFTTWRQGVSRYDGKTFINFIMQDGLAGNYINVVFEDREGNLWFGHGYANGLSKFDPHGLKNYSVQEGLAGTYVKSIAEDHQGNLWIAANGSVVKYDGTTFTQPVEESRRVIGNVTSILEDSGHNLWFATEDRGLIRYDGTNYTRFTTLNGLVGNRISSWNSNNMREDKNGRLWIGAWGGGVSRYDGNNFTNFTITDGLMHDLVTSLTEDKHGNIWIGTQKGGVSRYDGIRFTNFTSDDGLVSNIVFSIFPDARGPIWIGTLNGLNKYDGKSFTTVPEFAGKLISTIIEDRRGRLWFGTVNGGIIKTDGKTLAHITTADGLPSNRVFALREDKSGNIWIGTDEGLTKYTPQSIAPLIHIESIVSDKIYPDPTKISLPPGIRNLRINYHAISFRTRPEAMQYFYQLEGYDDNWRGPINERSVDYHNLKPGTYSFKVKAVDRDLNYSEPVSVTFKIVLPFYMTAAFLVPTASLGTILLITFTVLSIGFVKNRRRVLAYQRAAVQELQDARQMQMSLIPESAPPLEGFEIAGKCISANTVSGDFFDYLLSKRKNEIGIVIADVTGKGLKGAMNAVMTEGILHTAAKEKEKLSPASLLMELNNVLKDRIERNMNVTMVIGLIDAEGKTLTLANAGHHAHPILIRNGEIQPLKARGMPLGMKADIKYSEEQFPLGNGDVIIFMTDGIIEARNRSGEAFESNASPYSLNKTLSQLSRDASAKAMVDAIIADAMHFGGDKSSRDDDMTVVVAKVR